MTAPRHATGVSQRILLVVWKVIYRGALLFLALLLLTVVKEGLFPAGLETMSVRRAQALLFSNHHVEVSEMPYRVEFTLDGVNAVFVKGRQSYDDLVSLLQNGRSESLQEHRKLEPYHWSPVGELRIVSYGLPSHFKIYRSGADPNVYWIGLPKLTSPGTSFPFFTLDPQVIDFIKSASSPEARRSDLRDDPSPWVRIVEIGETVHEIAFYLYLLGAILIACFAKRSPPTHLLPLLSLFGYAMAEASPVPYAGSLLLLGAIAIGSFFLFRRRTWFARGTGVAGLLWFATAVPVSLANLLAPAFVPAEVNSHFSEKWFTERWLSDDLRPISISTQLDHQRADAALKLLSEAESSTLFSIDPKSRNHNPTAPGTICGYQIRKQLAINQEETSSVADSIINGVKKWRDTDGVFASCFEPHHAIEVQASQGRYDYVLCYECGVIAVFKDSTLLGGIGLSEAPTVLNQLLYPVAPK